MSEWSGVEGEEQVLKLLQQLTIKFAKDQESRSQIEVQVFKDVSKILGRRIDRLEDEASIVVLSEIFRFLRNAVARCKRNQDIVRDETEISDQVGLVMRGAEVPSERVDGEDRLIMQRCMFQFVTNFMVDNIKNAEIVRDKALLNMLDLLKVSQDKKVIQYAAMALHVLLKLLPEVVGVIKDDVLEILLNNADLEFVMYVIETFAVNKDFVCDHLPQMNGKNRARFVQGVVSHTDMHPKLPAEVVMHYSSRFQKKSDLIMSSSWGSDEWECWEIASVLELLCCVSALEENCIKTDTPLFITTQYMLQSVHSVGKNRTDDQEASASLEFASVPDIDVPKSHSEAMSSKPTFQFKAHLIRLIANLMHRNLKHQDLVRETETLSVILDCCNIDARNPFITQWAVLAIRNACEGNQANQEFVRSVQQLDTTKALSRIQLMGPS